MGGWGALLGAGQTAWTASCGAGPAAAGWSVSQAMLQTAQGACCQERALPRCETLMAWQIFGTRQWRGTMSMN